MSVCYTYQAIPYHPLIGRALGDDLVLEHILSFPRVHKFPPPNAAERVLTEELDAITRAIVAERPAIAGRRLYLDSWDNIYWLLAPNRRAGDVRDPQGLAERAIFGVEEFPSRPGVAIRFVRPKDAAVLGDCLVASLDGARADFDPAAMEKANVYKARREGDLDGMVEVLESLARLYREAADADECVLVANDHA
jgi:hypothetical protein